MDVGFVKAESTNLPRINSTMIHAFFFGNPDYCSAEQRNVKTSISGRESYGDDAIGYVQLKREETICTIKCKICPEHKVRIKHYSVTVVVDEHEEKVEKAQCEDCPAAAGGCKHAVAFLMWLHRRSEEPATTSISCYWKKSNLSKVGSSIKILTCKEMNKRKYKDPMPDTSLLNKFHEECKKRNIENCQFYKHSEDYREKKLKLSMHQLIWEFNYLNYEDFLLKIKDYFTKENLDYAEKLTREQNQSSMWFELRYGRVTASKSYEVSRCKTAEGSLMATIFGARTLQTPAIKRGQKLEVKVREVVEEMLGVKFFKCGLYISDKYPMIAGSPDGINREKGVLEIKCPSTENNFKNYIKDGKLTPKCYAQVQIQMFCAKVTDSYFCVASSDFESNKNVTILPVSYDATYTNELIKQIVKFWEHNVFPKLKESVI